MKPCISETRSNLAEDLRRGIIREERRDQYTSIAALSRSALQRVSCRRPSGWQRGDARRAGEQQRAATVRSAPEERMHDGRHTLHIPSGPFRASLSPGGPSWQPVGTHCRCSRQVPVIVHELTSLERGFFSAPRRADLPLLPYKGNIAARALACRGRISIILSAGLWKRDDCSHI